VEPARLLFEDVLRHRQGVAEARASMPAKGAETLVIETAEGCR
jgi:hypothetical protein